MRTDPRPLNCVTGPFLRWLSWCDQFLYRCEENGELTRDLPTARLPHHATIAVYPTAPPHVVLCPGLTRDLPIARSHHHATNAVHQGASPHTVFPLTADMLFCAAFNSSYASQKL